MESFSDSYNRKRKVILDLNEYFFSKNNIKNFEKRQMYKFGERL
jgi:hypothetical protein